MSPKNVRIVTALFDIKRHENGDGRKIEEYLIWFQRTLMLRCNMTIYTEERFKSFVEENRKNNDYETEIIIQKLEEIPFYKWRDGIEDIINSEEYNSKMHLPNRIECYLPEYNVIQYSKFGWLLDSSNINNDEYFFWMDAGCSRFFGEFNLDDSWPNLNKLDIDKITIQGNGNYVRSFDKMIPDEYVWDSNCMLVGTLFGGGKEIVKKLHDDINEIFLRYYKTRCVNNEQILLAVLLKEKKELFDVKVLLNNEHLPLFNMLK